jgi:N-acetylglucosamine kinase-like BadF-type ATPase
MKLIADSGSTKTDWKLVGDSGETKIIQTSGMNPFFRTEENIYQEIYQVVFPESGSRVQEIYFYGAGVVDAEKGEIVRKALTRVYPGATVETHSDMLGAARALFGSKPGIACILGTGSNCCQYDGNTIVAAVSPLGFILGDEGSGAVMGRKLLGDYFKEVMPAYLREAFGKHFHLTREEALNRVYRAEKPNQFLAQFVPFLLQHKNAEYCREFVRQNFIEFFERNVVKLPGAGQYRVGFCGSIAFYFEQILKNVAGEYGYFNIHLLKNPIDGLETYHLER